MDIAEKVKRYGSFQMTEDEYRVRERFEKGHGCSIKHEGATGGKTTISFTPTGIGTYVSVTCACGAKLDLTDDDNW